MSHEFKPIFDVELKCWCIGLSRVPEKVERPVLHQVIKDFTPVLREAIERQYQYDLLETAQALVRAGRCNISQKEVVFYLLSQLPTPSELTSEQAETLNQIVSQVERTYGGAVKRLEKKWKALENHSWKNSINDASNLTSLSFPPKQASLNH